MKTERTKEVQVNLTKNLHVSYDADLDKTTGKITPYLIVENLVDDFASTEDIKKIRIWHTLKNLTKI